MLQTLPQPQLVTVPLLLHVKISMGGAPVALYWLRVRYRRVNTKALLASGALAILQLTCSRPSSSVANVEPSVPTNGSSDAGQVKTASVPTRGTVDSGLAPVAVTTAERILTFAWKPSGASEREYSMIDPLDQHKILLTTGVERGKSYPLVLALHGQPRRGQAPRDYQFIRVVSDVARDVATRKGAAPFILVTPVFRFDGQNWPHFELAEFMAQVRRILQGAGIGTKGVYVFGHSGAVGCGGQGLNQVAVLSPAAVGFFDTCVGSGFVQAVTELAKNHVPTLIVHSVETAGFYPRQPMEYDPHFDFGKVYATLGLRPSHCPSHLPAAPLRNFAYQCAKNTTGSTIALVIDTGSGEKAHEALVPIAMRYFISQYVGRQ